MKIDPQNQINLEYLNHFLRNNAVNIQGCLRQIGNYLKEMNKAWAEYQQSFNGGVDEPEQK